MSGPVRKWLHTKSHAGIIHAGTGRAKPNLGRPHAFPARLLALTAFLCYYAGLNIFGRNNRMKKSEQEPLPSEGADAGTTSSSTSGAAALTPEQVQELLAQAAKAADSWERLVRVTADFENFKKRAAREKTEAAQYASQALLTRLLPVLDNFEMALVAAQAAQGDKLASLQSGVSMIQQQLKQALVDTGLEEIDALGKPFDPAIHEAVTQQESDSVPEDHVVQQLRKGYKVKDRLLRPASVIVAKTPAKQVAAQD